MRRTEDDRRSPEAITVQLSPKVERDPRHDIGRWSENSLSGSGSAEPTVRTAWGWANRRPFDNEWYGDRW